MGRTIISPIIASQIGSGAGGGASVGALLRQTGQTDLGLFIKYALADESWHLRGVERETEEAATAATAQYSAGSARLTLTFGASPRFTFSPRGSRTHQPEQINTYTFSHIERPAPGPAVAASYEYGDLVLTATTPGSAGNSWDFGASPGTAAMGAVNATADISMSTGRISIRSPNVAAAAASVEILRSGNNYINVVYNTSGPSGNGFIIRISYNSSGTAGVAAPAVLRDSDNNVIGIEVGGTGVVTLAAIVTALNGVSVGGQLVTATQQGGSGSRTFLDSSVDADFVMSGGTDGGGAATNTGNVRAIRGAARTGSAGETAKYEGSTTAGFLTLSWFEPGTDGNGFTILRRQGSGAGTRAFYEDNGNTYEDLVIHGPSGSTAGSKLEIRNAVNAARDSNNRQLIVATASAGAGQLAGFYPSAGGQDIVRMLAGGTTGTLTNPLLVQYSAGTNVLRITGLPTDTGAELVAAITKHSKFQEGDGTNPGDVWYTRGGSGTSTFTVPALMNQSFRNNFAGGTDATPRSPLRWLINVNSFSTTYQFSLTGIVTGDTVQNAIDAPITWLGTGNRISDLSTIITSKSNDLSTAIPVRLQVAASFTGGKNAATRQLPTVTQTSVRRNTASYQITYHGPSTPSGQRSTLTELKNAWDANFGNGFGHPITTITGSGGSRVSAVPASPSGGSNYVPPGPIELLVRPDDQTNGPNIEVRYHASQDTIAEIFTDTKVNSQGVGVVVVFGTDDSMAPEAPGFTRGLR